MKHESPSISATTKPKELKIRHNVKNVKYCSQMQYDDVTTNPIRRTAAILKIVFWLYLRDLLFEINVKFRMLKHNHIQAHDK